MVDCHWRAVSTPIPPASAPAPGGADTNSSNSELFHVGSEFGRASNSIWSTVWRKSPFAPARVVLDGPAHFTLDSKLGGNLQLGKLTARVPHGAHGFTVSTPAGKVVDLGTEFGVSVKADKTVEVEVFVGEVVVDASADLKPSLPSATPMPPIKVTAGHAAHVEAGKPVATIPLDPERFVRGLGPREDVHVVQAPYLDFVRSLKPVVWFRMEGGAADRVLHDEMGGPDAKLYWDGPGNPFVEGRLGKSLWLRGDQLKDWAILPDYPKAEHGKLSVVAWAYADSRSPYGSIVKNWLNTRSGGQFEFTLCPDGEGVDLAIKIADAAGRDVFVREGASHPFPLGQWQHVAFVTDGTTLRLYRQGREVGSTRHNGLRYPAKLQPLGIGVKIGPSGRSPDKSSPGFWDGKLDEVAIFNDALSPEDVRKLASAAPR